MPFDIIDAFHEIQTLKLSILELQKKVFPEKFKEEKAK